MAFLAMCLLALAAFPGAAPTPPVPPTGAATAPAHGPAKPQSSPSSTASDDAEPIRVVSLNIRYENRTDADHSWSARRPVAIQFLHDSAADFIGLQEVLPTQRKDLMDGLPEWGSIGRTREASSAEGESTPIFYRRDRWQLVESRSGTFWLSETPSVAGSRDWKSACPRIATWGVMRERRTGRLVMVLNTHLDHQSQEAREHGAAVIARFLKREAEDLPVIVLGDFNAGPRNPARATLCEGVDGSPKLRDSFAVRHGDDEAAAGTFHGFKGGTGGLRIDAILVSDPFDIVDASIVHTPEGGTHLSDHYPIAATIRLKASDAIDAPKAAPSSPEG